MFDSFKKIVAGNVFPDQFDVRAVWDLDYDWWAASI